MASGMNFGAASGLPMSGSGPIAAKPVETVWASIVLYDSKAAANPRIGRHLLDCFIHISPRELRCPNLNPALAMTTAPKLWRMQRQRLMLQLDYDTLK
jgi:hypothetical protein